jgi:hypothetical protein
LLTVCRSFMNVASSVLWRMAIILKANTVNLFVSSVLFVFWYQSPNFLDAPRISSPITVRQPSAGFHHVNLRPEKHEWLRFPILEIYFAPLYHELSWGTSSHVFSVYIGIFCTAEGARSWSPLPLHSPQVLITLC